LKPYIVLPGQAILDLREELELIEDEEAGATLERFGYRAGVNLVRELGVECADLEELKEVLPQLWYETGLSGIELESVERAEITAIFHDSVESSHGKPCDFARGYLAGIVSSLIEGRFTAIEPECVSRGDPICRIVLRPMEQVVGVRKLAAGKPALELERGYSYLIKTEDPAPAFGLFEDYLAHGLPGMCISREYPEKLKKRYKIEGASMLWLSYDRDIPYVREPTNIPLIYSEIKGFLDSDQEVVVMISGLEYMISQSTFIKVLKFVQLLNENVAVRDSLMLLPLSPATLDDKEVRQLERELRVLDLNARSE
jgi:predicted hydrocarbon binding protein